LAEHSELASVVVSLAAPREGHGGVTNTLDVDSAATSPTAPEVKCFDVSSQDRDVVEGVAEPRALVVTV
jgi:hypothetical protein